ncbi:MAG TPA: hypothetical protein VKR32_03455 [Puia sp.]|nr:hypothetical protein [Puia sp.]
MKKLLVLSLLVLFFTPRTNAQLTAKPTCGVFSVDILNGTLNNLKPNFKMPEIKENLPCFTGETKGDSACGDALFFKDRDVKFFVKRQYIELGPNFKGKLSIPLMGADRETLFKWLGNPKIKDPDWDAFQTQYGTLVLHYAAGKVKVIQFSTKNTDELSLCQ